MLWAIQPDKASVLFASEDMQESGMLARILVASSFHSLPRGIAPQYCEHSETGWNLQAWETLLHRIFAKKPLWPRDTAQIMVDERPDQHNPTEVRIADPRAVYGVMARSCQLAHHFNAEESHELRCIEICGRLALILAVADDPAHPVISVEHAERSLKLMEYFLRCRQLMRSDSAYDDRLRKLHKLFRQAERQGWPRDGSTATRSGTITRCQGVTRNDLLELAQYYPSIVKMEPAERNDSYLVYLKATEYERLPPPHRGRG